MHTFRTRRRAAVTVCAVVAIVAYVAATPVPVCARNSSTSMLMRAAGRPNTARLESLLSSGASANAYTATNKTPLQAAAQRDLTANVSVLLRHGALIDALGFHGITALGWAARKGHERTARALLDAGADPDAAKSPERSPIALAVVGDHIAVARLLIERGSRVFEKPELAAAVLAGLSYATDPQVAELVASRITAYMPEDPVRLRDAVEVIVAGSPAVAEVVARALGPLKNDKQFQTALLITAVEHGRLDLATTAIRGGADINARDPELGTPLALATVKRDSAAASLLISAGADPASVGDNARLEELAGDTLRELHALGELERAGDIDRPDAEGQTPLYRAAQRGNFFLVDGLLKRHADPATTVMRWPGDSGWTPLMAASAGGQRDVVEALLGAGASVDQRNTRGRTALMFAAWYGRAPVAALLLSVGADPNAADNLGQTPLILAEASGDAETIEILRERNTMAVERRAHPVPHAVPRLPALTPPAR